MTDEVNIRGVNIASIHADMPDELPQHLKDARIKDRERGWHRPVAGPYERMAMGLEPWGS